MPTLADLQQDVLGKLNLNAGTLRNFGNNLEQWMSFLSVDQPWLSHSDNLRNRALFREASHAVASAIAAAETDALNVPVPLWLQRMVATWFDAECSLISFNYDTLIERAAAQDRRLSNWGDIYGMPLAIRPTINHGLSFGTGRYAKLVPELFKLHGSINWAFPGLDSSPSDPVTIVNSYGLWNGEQYTVVPNRGEGAARHADLEPLIIPPTGTKGDFYSNRSLQAQWRAAYHRLSEAESVTIIGYSFPASDLGARHFVANAISREIPVIIVDYSPSTAEQIQSFLGDSRSYDLHTGPDAVTKYVDAHCGQRIVWGAAHTPESIVPYLRINNELQPHAEREWSGRTFESRDEAIDCVERYLEARYPGVSARGVDSWVLEEASQVKTAVTESVEEGDGCWRG